MASLSRQPNALLARVQWAGAELIDGADEMVERLAARRQLDQRADAAALEVYHLLSRIRREPARAVELAAVAQSYQAESIRLDTLEDEHITRIAEIAAALMVWGRQVVSGIHSFFGGKP